MRQAAVAGGAVGELPTLARRLHGVALDLDRLLAMGDGIAPGSSGLNEARRQMVAVVEAANDIRSAAVASAGDAARTRVLSLTEDADREVRSLAAGLARARAAFPARQSA